MRLLAAATDRWQIIAPALILPVCATATNSRSAARSTCEREMAMVLAPAPAPSGGRRRGAASMDHLDGERLERLPRQAVEPRDQLRGGRMADFDDRRADAGQPRCLRGAEIGVVDTGDRQVSRTSHARPATRRAAA